jgi:predicted SAM-dependent methyltransferase
MKLHLGCGNTRLEGYVNYDIISGPAVDKTGPIDNLDIADGTVKEILTEHMIEHLTFEEFNRAIVEWYRVLEANGCLVVECPDLLGVCKEFVEANLYNQYSSFKGYWPLIAHVYGHQRGKTKEEKLSQVHRSGYTEEYLTAVLQGVGFSEITREPPQKHNYHSPTLRLRAVK